MTGVRDAVHKRRNYALLEDAYLEADRGESRRPDKCGPSNYGSHDSLHNDMLPSAEVVIPNLNCLTVVVPNRNFGARSRSSSICGSSRLTRSARPTSACFPKTPWTALSSMPPATRSNTTCCGSTPAKQRAASFSTTTACLLNLCCTGSAPTVPARPGAFPTSCRHCRSSAMSHRNGHGQHHRQA